LLVLGRNADGFQFSERAKVNRQQSQVAGKMKRRKLANFTSLTVSADSGRAGDWEVRGTYFRTENSSGAIIPLHWQRACCTVDDLFQLE
jgi:hypothetical protein